MDLRVLLLCHGLNEVALLLLRLLELGFQSGYLIGHGVKSRFLLLEWSLPPLLGLLFDIRELVLELLGFSG